MKLIVGRWYWLGATWGEYREEKDGSGYFSLGNCFVRRGETRFSAERISEVSAEDLVGKETYPGETYSGAPYRPLGQRFV